MPFCTLMCLVMRSLGFCYCQLILRIVHSEHRTHTLKKKKKVREKNLWKQTLHLYHSDSACIICMFNCVLVLAILQRCLNLSSFDANKFFFVCVYVTPCQRFLTLKVEVPTLWEEDWGGGITKTYFISSCNEDLFVTAWNEIRVIKQLAFCKQTQGMPINTLVILLSKKN